MMLSIVEPIKLRVPSTNELATPGDVTVNLVYFWCFVSESSSCCWNVLGFYVGGVKKWIIVNFSAQNNPIILCARVCMHEDMPKASIEPDFSYNDALIQCEQFFSVFLTIIRFFQYLFLFLCARLLGACDYCCIILILNYVKVEE